jgi:2-succinyl-5-enolpyruvyl-6-hydroxy-3-cyclohexene-1-carboxylate synthase
VINGERFEGVTFSFGLPYTRVHTRADFATAYLDAQKMSRTSVIEVVSNIDENLAQHRALEAAIDRALASASQQSSLPPKGPGAVFRYP